MADNVAITAGSGTTVHADEYTHGTLGSGKTQLVKLVDGTLDSDTAIAAGGGVEAGALRVTVASDSTGVLSIDDNGGSLTVDGTVTANLGATDNAVLDVIAADTTSLDGKVTACNTGAVVLSSGTVTTVSTVTNLAQMGGAALNMGEGTISTGTQRVTLATDDDGVAHLATIAGDTTSIDGKITACNTGAVVVSSGAITETNSTDILADTANIDTNITSILADTASMDTNLGTVAGAVSGSEMQVDIVADGAGLATSANQTTIIGHVDGIETVLGTIDSDTSSLAGCVGGTELQVDVVASLPAGDNNIGNVDIASSVALDVSAATVTVDGTVDLGATDNAVLDSIDTATTATQAAVEIIDDWDAVHDSAASSDGPQLMAAYDSTKPTAVADGDAVRILADSYGRLLSGMEPERFQAVYDSSDATGEGETVKAATASKKIYILSAIISSDVEGWIKLQDEDSTALTGKLWLKAGGGMALTWPPEAPLVLDVANKALEVIAEAAGDVSVTVTGYLAP